MTRATSWKCRSLGRNWLKRVKSALFLTGDVLARKVIVDEKPAVVGVGGADGDDLHNHEMCTKMMRCGGLQ
jgi:hypothetical protein